VFGLFYFLLLYDLKPRRRIPTVGETASYDVVCPRDVEFVDKEETERFRREEAERIPVQYRRDEAAHYRISLKLTEILQYIYEKNARALAGEYGLKLSSFPELSSRKHEELLDIQRQILGFYQLRFRDGLKADDARKITRELPPRLSGHQATCLLQCPARYFFEALGLQAPSIREERLDPLGEGAVLHRVMETLGKKLPEPKSKAEILAAIDEICRRLEATWEERLLFSLLEHSGCWERLADFLLEGGRKSLAVEEWVEADLEPVAGLPIRGVGKIDRRDRGPAGERLVDYKRNKIPSKKAINSFDDVQLLFYALLKELNDEKIDAIAYYSLRRQQQNCSEAEVEPLLPVFRELLAQQLTGIAEAGGYRKIINGHCDSCPYREICLDESQLRTANGQA
jgi:RecB family exonuclease